MIARRAVLARAGLILAAASGPAHAAGRPIRIIIGYDAGGMVDSTARLVAEALRLRLAAPVLIINVPGAAGLVAARYVARSAADGATIGYVSSGVMNIAPQLNPDMNFDASTALLPVCEAFSIPNLVIVRRDSKLSSLAALIAAAKAAPATIRYGTPGVNSINHLTAELLQSVAGIKLVHVPYKGAAAYALDLVAGRIEIAFGSTGTLDPYIDVLKGLVVAAPERSKLAPDVASATELGYPAFQSPNWGGYFLPAATPEPIAAQFDAAFGAILADDAVTSRILHLGVEPSYQPQDRFKELIPKEYARITSIIHQAGLQPVR